MTPEVELRHRDLQSTIDKLSNGHRGDPIAMSEGIVNISKTLQLILMMNFVTEEKCQLSHNILVEDNKRNRFGWKKLAAVLVACATLFGLGTELIGAVWGSPAADVIIHAAQSNM